jgi:hypothetical protein
MPLTRRSASAVPALVSALAGISNRRLPFGHEPGGPPVKDRRSPPTSAGWRTPRTSRANRRSTFGRCRGRGSWCRVPSVELGDPEVARQHYEGLVASFTPSDKFFLATAYERLGRIHEAAGRVDQAIYWYGRFVQSWADADAPLIPSRRAAEQRPETLRARAGQVGIDGPRRSRSGPAGEAP